MSLSRLHLVDFRIFAEAELAPDPEGTTVIVGPNGTGKTSLLEAVAYLGLQRSFRGAPKEAVVRTGARQAFVRADLHADGRPLLVEVEVALEGRSRAQVNRQPARTRRDLAEAVPVTVFSPDDLGVVQGGPARRRELLDDALRLLDPSAAALLDEVDRVLRQRAALLRQAGGRLSAEVATTLDVWDDRLARSGGALADARRGLTDRLEPWVVQAYAVLAGAPEGPGRATVALAYQPSWEGDLDQVLAANRAADVRRAVTGAGPHRDDLSVLLAGRDARVQASQGEQRCLALALRLGVHRLVTEERRAAPILLLDDVFSELDPDRSRALVVALPAGQTLLTTAVPLPAGVEVACTVDVRQVGTRPGTGPVPVEGAGGR